MEVAEVRTFLRDSTQLAGRELDVLRHLSAFVADDAIPTDTARELVIRAAARREAFAQYAPILEDLLRVVGLYPYLESAATSSASAIALEYHRPDNMDERDVVFHAAQLDVYNRLLLGKNVILSAPTSFGKSLIIDALIASGQYGTVSVIVPTLALVDETRRRLRKHFSQTARVVTQPTDDVPDEGLVVYVMTQERYLGVNPDPAPDLLVIDEFYKLDPSRKDQRFSLLNEILFRQIRGNRQFYLLGPNISGVEPPQGLELEYEFVQRRFSTVVSELEHVAPAPSRSDALVEVLQRANRPTAVFCAHPRRTSEAAQIIADAGAVAPGVQLTDACDWIRREYHPEWEFPRFLEAGIGVHHGRVPRPLAQTVLRYFEEEKIQAVVCTSTIIEGVNTSARSVVLYDNAISTEPLDFFSFSNIRGRAGRMFRHFVGEVFVFDDPPEPTLPAIDIPAITQSEAAPEGFLIQLDWEELLPESRTRVEPYFQEGKLPLELLRRQKGTEPAILVELADAIRAEPAAAEAALGWSGSPTWDGLLAFWDFCWPIYHLRGGSGVRSAKHLTFLLWRLGKGASWSRIIAEDVSNDRFPVVLSPIRQDTHRLDNPCQEALL